MKKIISVLLLVTLIVVSVTGCKKENAADGEMEITKSETTKTEEKESDDKEAEDEASFDYVDYSGLGMKMKGYDNHRDGVRFFFYNDYVLITCARLVEENDSNTPKNIDAFNKRFYDAFNPLLWLETDNYDMKEIEEETINGFLAKKYEGTVTASSDKSLTAKAYTFVCNNNDYIVLAVVREENSESIAMMKKEIDVFMNNLGVVE